MVTEMLMIAAINGLLDFAPYPKTHAQCDLAYVKDYAEKLNRIVEIEVDCDRSAAAEWKEDIVRGNGFVRVSISKKGRDNPAIRSIALVRTSKP